MHERANDDIFYIEDLTRLLEPKILGHNEKTSKIWLSEKAYLDHDSWYC